MRPPLSRHIEEGHLPVFETVKALNRQIAACVCIKDCDVVATLIEEEREKYGNEFQCYDRLTDLLANKVISLEWEHLLLMESTLSPSLN